MNSSEPRFFLAFGGVIAVQTIAALLWAGGAAERLAQLEERIDQSTRLMERTARLEAQTDHIRQTLVRIEKKIDQVGGQ